MLCITLVREMKLFVRAAVIVTIILVVAGSLYLTSTFRAQKPQDIAPTQTHSPSFINKVTYYLCDTYVDVESKCIVNYIKTLGKDVQLPIQNIDNVIYILNTDVKLALPNLKVTKESGEACNLISNHEFKVHECWQYNWWDEWGNSDSGLLNPQTGNIFSYPGTLGF